MNVEELIQKLEAEFEDIPKGTLKPDTNIAEIKGWGSMHALIVIALIDTEYGVTIKGDELRQITSVQQLYDLVQQKKASGAVS